MKKILLLIILVTACTFSQENRIVRQNELSDSLNVVRALIGTGGIALPDSTVFASELTPYATKVITNSLAEDIADNKFYVSVKEYGAVGDGVTDDLSAIQSAVDAVQLAGGGTIFVPASDNPYIISDYIRVDSDYVTIKGSGFGSVIKLKDNAFIDGENMGMLWVNTINWEQQDAPDTRLQYFSLQDITFDYNGDNNTGTAPLYYYSNIYVQFSDHIYFNHVLVKNVIGTAIQIADSRYINITNSTVENMRERFTGWCSAGIVVGDRDSRWDASIYPDSLLENNIGGYVQITNNTIIDGDCIGIEVMSNGSITIANNIVSDVTHGIVSEVGWAPMNDAVISGNTVSGFSVYGISISRAAASTYVSPGSQRTLIANNIIRGDDSTNNCYGIQTGLYDAKVHNNIISGVDIGINFDESGNDSVAGTVGNIIVSDNFIKLHSDSSGNAGINFARLGTPYLTNIDVKNNVVNANYADGDGIIFSGFIKDINISGNRTFNSLGGSGIKIGYSGDYPYNVTIKDNEAYDNAVSGIYLNYSVDSVMVTGNRSYNNAYGIYVRDSSEVILLRDNILLSNEISPTYIGANAVVTDLNNVTAENAGILTLTPSVAGSDGLELDENGDLMPKVQ